MHVNNDRYAAFIFCLRGAGVGTLNISISRPIIRLLVLSYSAFRMSRCLNLNGSGQCKMALVLYMLALQDLQAQKSLR